MARDRLPGSLPAETANLVGRRAELAEISRLIEQSSLVTLTGVGGVGKTRLALRVAAQMRTRFADGVWWVALSPLPDGALLGHTIGEALGVAHQTLRPMDEVLCQYLAGRRMLLVLDTCEHLVDMCAVKTEMLLDAAPGVTILATSRRPLEVAGEHVFVVDPLPVPAPHAAEAGSDDAVALFADRAAAALSGDAPGMPDRAAVAEVCRRLDGLPLAIELAAARLRDLSFDQLVERLDDRFGVLADVGHDAPPRHQAMRTAIGWSHELCEPQERLLWARLSVFAGDFDAKTAEQICADQRLPVASLVEVLLALVDKSVLTRTETAVGPRYRMLNTIREYGAGWLRNLDEEGAVRRRHRDHYLALARQGAAEWLGPDQVAWCDRLWLEHDELRAALEFSIAEPEGHTALELAGSLWFFWYGCGFAKEGHHYLERALILDDEPSLVRNQALWVCAMVLTVLGDAAGCAAKAAECAKYAEQLGDTDAAVAARFYVGVAAVLDGDLAQAESAMESLLAAHRGDGELLLFILMARLVQSHLFITTGRLEQAITVLTQLRAACDERDERNVRAYADFFRAQAEMVRGRPAAAVIYAQAALEIKHRMHDTLGVAMALDVLASAAAATGRGERAARLLGLAQQVWHRQGALPQAGIREWVAARRAGETRAREVIGDQAYEKAYQAGYGFDLDEGIGYALSDPENTPGRPTAAP
jgi:predicted ATPase